MRRHAFFAGAVTALIAGSTAGLLVAGGQQLGGSFFDALTHPAIAYGVGPSSDPVAALNRQLQDGTAHLRFDPARGYLTAVLEALHVPIESQMVVFSKTSRQAAIINPMNPRSVFFNDSVAVALPRGGFIELAAHDPRQGVLFYVLDQRQVDRPAFGRPLVCVSCHHSYAGLGVPGWLVRSVSTTATGLPAPQLGNYVSDHRSPFEERWGGWFVTGNAGSIHHMGQMSKETESLKEEFNTDSYLSPYSDVVALLVFDHQARMINLITRVGWEVRVALADHRRDLADLLRSTAAELVNHLLFVDEAPLAGPIRGTSGFSETFTAPGPRDGRGRSLRQLDLATRLMRYPCSCMIYTPAFDGLPRDAIYARMWQILSGGEKSAKYARLSASDRQKIVEILRDTKKDLPGYFQPATRQRS